MAKEKQVTYVRAARKPDSNKLRLIFPGRGEVGEFVNCTEEVKVSATKSFNDGDQVNIEIETVEGTLTVTKISAIDQVKKEAPIVETEELKEKLVEKKETPAETETGSDSKTSKDEKPKTVTGNFGLKVSTKPLNTYGANYQKEFTPETAERVLRMSVFNSACIAVGALNAQVDLNTIGDVVLGIYKKGLQEIKKD
ncbi:MAG TPA: hypothetical protein ENI61_04235 [Ignavibacteria bacterium]|nr:hypothetical protein [Ignavibacteria bacterium]